MATDGESWNKKKKQKLPLLIKKKKKIGNNNNDNSELSKYSKQNYNDKS